MPFADEVQERGVPASISTNLLDIADTERFAVGATIPDLNADRISCKSATRFDPTADAKRKNTSVMFHDLPPDEFFHPVEGHLPKSLRFEEPRQVGGSDGSVRRHRRCSVV